MMHYPQMKSPAKTLALMLIVFAAIGYFYYSTALKGQLIAELPLTLSSENQTTDMINLNTEMYPIRVVLIFTKTTQVQSSTIRKGKVQVSAIDETGNSVWQDAIHISPGTHKSNQSPKTGTSASTVGEFSLDKAVNVRFTYQFEGWHPTAASLRIMGAN
ncbi:MAG: hypothetical protein ACPG51_05120 [Thiolinea sp.]